MRPEPETTPRGRDAARAAAPRVLVLAESLPWRPLKGGDLRNWQHVHALAGAAEVGVFGLCSNDRRRSTPPDLPLAFWTAARDPALASPPPKGLRLSARAWLLDPGGHPADLLHSRDAEAELAGLLASFRPHVVVLEGLWMHRYLGAVRDAGCRAILDCHNVEAAVAQQLAAAAAGGDLEARVVREVLPARTEAIERAALSSVDEVWACSEEDARRLHERYAPRAPIRVIPNAIRVEDYPVRARARESDRLTLVYPGIFSYLPNASAARFLVHEVLPLLTAASGAACRVQLVGAMPTPEMEAWSARDPRVEVTGAVPDVRPYLAGAAAMAVPLFEASGTRFKLLEAFAAGLPVVTTSKGAEGLGARDGTHVLLAETPEAFVDAVLALWRDDELARRLAESARVLVAERFSWQAVAPLVREAAAGAAAARAAG